MAAQKKNVARTASTWDQVERGYKPQQEVVDCDELTFIVQELSGKLRFEAAKKADEDRWDMMLWLCDVGIIEPRPPDMETFEAKVLPEHVLKISKAVMALSGMKVDEDDEDDEAGKESAGGSGTGTS